MILRFKKNTLLALNNFFSTHLKIFLLNNKNSLKLTFDL